MQEAQLLGQVDWQMATKREEESLMPCNPVYSKPAEELAKKLVEQWKGRAPGLEETRMEMSEKGPRSRDTLQYTGMLGKTQIFGNNSIFFVLFTIK